MGRGYFSSCFECAGKCEDQVGEISILLFVKFFTVFLTLKGEKFACAAAMLHAVVRHEGVTCTQDHINQGLNIFKRQKKRRPKFVIGAYILVFDFFLKNSFQVEQWLYPFKRLTRLLSSHFVHLDHLTPACCICLTAPNSCGFSKLLHS